MKRMTQTSLIIFLSGFSFLLATTDAQRPLFRGSEAPGATAFKRLIADPTLAGYDQPVRIVVPAGGQVSHWGQGHFSKIGFGTMLGLQVGPVYRLKISAILRGKEKLVYPTIEMVDRIYPPAGLAFYHPVKAVITREDIEDAAAGKMITKVVYLEDPDTALPYRQQLEHQATIDIGQGRDPYVVAERLGRPMAIIRIGSRQPILGDRADSSHYEHPVRLFEAPQNIENISAIHKNSKLGVHRASNHAALDDHNAPPIDESTACAQNCKSTICPGTYQCSPEEISSLPKHRRDEFICDGNDRGMQVVADVDWKLVGLDIEDTIAHFDTLDGKILVAPSNRVCIYSPRFAAVRRILQSNSETIMQKLNVSNRNTSTVLARSNDFSSTTLQNVQLQSNRKTERVSAFRDQTRGVLTENTVKLLGARHHFKPFEDLQFVRFGKFASTESARLGMAIQSAVAWDSDVRAQISKNNQQPVIVNEVNQTRELMVVDSNTSPDFRLCKLASTISAQPGDTVDFTIRFDNIGREKIGNVTIVDNLSPRLEFVKGTAECSVAAELTTQKNQAGSLTLRWEIADPVNVRDGGLIRFQCIVR